MRKPRRLLSTVAALALLFTGCGQSFESAFRDITNLYGKVADILQTVDDVESAQAATLEIEALVPSIQKAGIAMHKAVSRFSDPSDMDPKAMMACAHQQRRLAVEIKRLSDDREVWQVIQPAMAQTMLLKAMPPR